MTISQTLHILLHVEVDLFAQMNEILFALVLVLRTVQYALEEADALLMINVNVFHQRVLELIVK
jgi:hypothetical protein